MTFSEITARIPKRPISLDGTGYPCLCGVPVISEITEAMVARAKALVKDRISKSVTVEQWSAGVLAHEYFCTALQEAYEAIFGDKPGLTLQVLDLASTVQDKFSSPAKHSDLPWEVVSHAYDNLWWRLQLAWRAMGCADGQAREAVS